MIITDETTKGVTALLNVKLDLVSKNLIPLNSEIEQLPFDLCAYNPENNSFLKFQVKFAGVDRVRVKNTKYNYRTKQITKYHFMDFDYYAIFVPQKNRVLYIPFSFGGKNISFTINDSGKPFNWWEDFLEIKNHSDYKRKTCRDFNIPIKKYGGRIKNIKEQ